MRLAFVCTEMLPSPAIRGGAIQILIDGVTPVIAQNHELTIFSVADPDLPTREKCHGVEYIRFPNQNYSNSVAEFLSNNEPFDVIHVFNRPRNVYAYKQASPKTRFVLSLHNEMFHPKKLSDEASLRCIESLETIMTVSDYISSTVTSRFPLAAEKMKTVYSGVDLNCYCPSWSAGDKRTALREKYGLINKKVILFVGRLSVKKGPHILVQALQSILPKHPDAVLVIVGSRWFGDNSINEYVQTLYKLSEPVNDKIVFTGFVSPFDIPDHFVIGDVFVCCSQWQEPLARVHYEAMAAGLPIISTNRGGNTEVITHLYNGIVIDDYSNPAAIAKALDSILSCPGMADILAKRGREIAEKRFSFTRVAEDLQNIYQEAFTKENE
ncbi:MAG: glycosyltransferase family 4 protein [Eubacteriales bacterium]